ncbi:hypothetical protein [Cupriavidus metallidurans]|uniref:hypothetical protein n=1 Tax=Cupriavidus metallidurans TaxID=119219 RepID=UPI001646CC34|nr:hypothetical protein [Cupriavidus metallidurans]
MASEVDIANLSLGHLGDEATVASLYPPEGSAQADHCARFYPIARDSLLELHTWGFSTTRIKLALLSSGWPEWDYAYAQPNDMLNSIAVLPPDAIDDYSAPPLAGYCNVPLSAGGAYVPQAYSCETDDQGNQLIYTDQPNAVLRYTKRVTDVTKFSPLFVTTLSWHLASMLAGPIIKGDVGAAEAKRCAAMMQMFLSKAIESDAGQRRIAPQHVVPWISGR